MNVRITSLSASTQERQGHIAALFQDFEREQRGGVAKKRKAERNGTPLLKTLSPLLCTL
jgi:hypothetical protein